MDVDVKPGACPGCGRPYEALADAVGDAAPKAGDFTVCLYCAVVSVWDGEGQRRPTQAELLEAAENRDLQRARSLILERIGR